MLCLWENEKENDGEDHLVDGLREWEGKMICVGEQFG